ncbi:hypothetical protein V6N12_075203 [Hibiscus sabdariffa]|uniref:Uncharacterized protein n=1 Tax=Hibiscus sabdariffa TaxID=183260 RepID=A0ABR2C006_9ROSI
MVDERGEWNWIHLQGLLPAATLERLAACPIPKPLYGDDCPGWRWEDNRCFKVGSAYDYLAVLGATHISGFFEQPFESWLERNGGGGFVSSHGTRSWNAWLCICNPTCRPYDPCGRGAISLEFGADGRRFGELLW